MSAEENTLCTSQPELVSFSVLPDMADKTVSGGCARSPARFPSSSVRRADNPKDEQISVHSSSNQSLDSPVATVTSSTSPGWLSHAIQTVALSTVSVSLDPPPHTGLSLRPAMMSRVVEAKKGNSLPGQGTFSFGGKDTMDIHGSREGSGGYDHQWRGITYSRKTDLGKGDTAGLGEDNGLAADGDLGAAWHGRRRRTAGKSSWERVVGGRGGWETYGDNRAGPDGNRFEGRNHILRRCRNRGRRRTGAGRSTSGEDSGNSRGTGQNKLARSGSHRSVQPPPLD